MDGKRSNARYLVDDEPWRTITQSNYSHNRREPLDNVLDEDEIIQNAKSREAGTGNVKRWHDWCTSKLSRRRIFNLVSKCQPQH